MTKEELLKIYSAYLPYALTGQLICNKVEDFEWQDWADDLTKFEKGSIWQLCGYADDDLNIPMGEGDFSGWLWRNGNTYVNFHTSVKPVLYDLSYLTKEIEHEGERFVPTERLMNYAYNFGVNRGVFEHMLSSILDGNTLITELPYYLIIKLLEWHLNVFQLPEDQFINKATLTNK